MTRDKFYELVGEYPEDVLGQDWENEVSEYLEDGGYLHDGHLVGNCMVCKDGI